MNWAMRPFHFGLMYTACFSLKTLYPLKSSCIIISRTGGLITLTHARNSSLSSPTEVREVLASKVGSLLEFTEQRQATEYLQSLHYWPDKYKESR